ncbi:MAG: TIGR03032 family protein [Planctomycetes bacterium]|nr:TIGR03032 family protein [Planctomycetota bacterium]
MTESRAASPDPERACATPDKGQEPLRSVHTSTFPDILRELGASLLVSTYQAGKVVVVREDGGALNTHFRDYLRPMGLAANGKRLAVGTSNAIFSYRNVPAVSRRLESPGKCDLVYLLAGLHVTGDIDIHEMAWAEGELWFVNTRFSCLATLDLDHSFVPRWRPPFVTALAPEDRCHLNGLAVADGRPRYVTAYGETDTAEGWRERKADGGCLVDARTGEVVIRGLSMPHSPRLHAGRLWLLESGAGRLSVVDSRAGRAETVAELPGFTRGLDLLGPFAFVGLSQVRESTIASGTPIAERNLERLAGVWVIDIRTGQTVAFLKFEDAVQEIFAVQVLPGVRYPEIITDDTTLLGSTYVLPEPALAEVPPERRS